MSSFKVTRLVLKKKEVVSGPIISGTFWVIVPSREKEHRQGADTGAPMDAGHTALPRPAKESLAPPTGPA